MSTPAKAFLSLSLACAAVTSAASAQEVPWHFDYGTARHEAKQTRRPLILDFGTRNCFWCQKMDETTFRDSRIVRLLRECFIVVKIDAEKEAALTEALGIRSYPTLVFATCEGKILGRHEGYVEATRFHQQLQRALRESEADAPAPAAVMDMPITSAEGAAPHPIPLPDRGRAAQQLLSQAQEAYRTGRYLRCLEHCKYLEAAYPDLPEAADAHRLAAVIMADPDKAQRLRAALADLLGEIYLTNAETALRQGQTRQAIEYLEQVERLCPASPHSQTAQGHLSRLRAHEPVIRAQSP
ncbi:MAG: thioredoxin fold domain-containing protein [Gemmataceae bacterium]